MKKIFGCIVALTIGAITSSADSVTITPSADTSLFELNPDGNMGTTFSLAAGTIANFPFTRSRALIKFDLAGSIPSNATITSARLNVTVVKAPSSGGANSTFNLNRMLKSWQEGAKSEIIGRTPASAGEPTWQNRAAPSTAWSTPGTGAPADFVSITSASTQILGARSTPYTFASSASLVADVQAWLQNPGTNFGWIMMTQSEGTPATARRFGAKEDSANAARLIVDFTVPTLVAPAITQQPASRTVLVGGSTSLSVTATGATPLSYQWKLNGTNLAGVTNSTVSMVNVQSAQAGSYSVTVANAAGTTNSVAATLTVISSPTIARISRAGSNLSLQFAATGGATYQIQSRSAVSSGAWSSLTNITVASGQQVTVLTPYLTTAQNFYRLSVDVAP